MLGWAIGFFVAAIVAAIFGFGGVATAFIGIAQLLFWVFVILFVVSLLFGLFAGATHTDGVGRHGSTVGPIVALLAVGLLVYAWMDNHWSAEKLGRSIDHGAAQITADASNVLGSAGDHAENAVNHAEDNIHEGTERATNRRK